MKYQTKVTPLYTQEACGRAFVAGALVEFTACGCDYDLPAYPRGGSAGWVPLEQGDAPVLFARPFEGDRFRAFYPEPEA